MKFKLGQEITPNKKQFASTFGEMAPQFMPKFGEVYTVRAYPFPCGAFATYLSLDQFPEKKLYHEDSFEPLVSTDHLEDALREVDHDLKEIKKLADGLYGERHKI